MPSQQVEREVKLDIDLDARLPDLQRVVTLGDSRAMTLTATYFDTPSMALIRNRVTLRRRQGGHDDGWHLKLPQPDGSRLELHAALDGPRLTVPVGHREVVAGTVGLAPLLPVAELVTRRVERDLCSEDGTVQAVLCDDTVTATPAGTSWRELEVELTPQGDPAVLDRVVAALQADGIRLADSPSKLSRAIGHLPDGPDGRPTPDSTAAEVVLAYVREQVGVIQGREAAVRVDAPDAVHKSRVATRRLRSALRVFGRLLDAERTAPLRQELRWLADVLGAARDAEVLKKRLLQDATDVAEERVPQAVTRRIAQELDTAHDVALARLGEALDSERYAELSDALVRFATFPPWRARADERARTVLPKLVARAVAKVERELDAAREAAGEQRLHLLHEARKRAKAARYAHEALAPAFGEPAAAAAKRWEAVTESLGGLQDSVVAAHWLREVAATEEQEGEARGFDVLIRRELERARAAEHESQAVLDAAVQG